MARKTSVFFDMFVVAADGTETLAARGCTEVAKAQVLRQFAGKVAELAGSGSDAQGCFVARVQEGEDTQVVAMVAF